MPKGPGIKRNATLSPLPPPHVQCPLRFRALQPSAANCLIAGGRRLRPGTPCLAHAHGKSRPRRAGPSSPVPGISARLAPLPQAPVLQSSGRDRFSQMTPALTNAPAQFFFSARRRGGAGKTWPGRRQTQCRIYEKWLSKHSRVVVATALFWESGSIRFL